MVMMHILTEGTKLVVSVVGRWCWFEFERSLLALLRLDVARKREEEACMDSQNH